MRAAGPLALVLALSAVAAAADDAPEWKGFTSKDGGFTVLMPGTPKQDKRETRIDIWRGVLHTSVVRVGNTWYAVHYTDFAADPEYDVETVTPKRVYNSVRNEMVSDMGFKLAGEKEVKVGRFPARDVLIDVAGGRWQYRVRVVLVRARLYKAMVRGTPEEVTGKDADKFLDSLKLTEK